MPVDPNEVSRFITDIVAQAPQHLISGSRLAAALRRHFPSFSASDYECRNFRDFIRRHVPQVGEGQRRSGTDVVYILKSPVLPNSLRSDASEILPSADQPIGIVSLLLNSPQAWKTFASPHSSSRLFVRSDGTAVRILARQSSTPDSSWLHVESISADALKQIGKEFADLAPELYRKSLVDSLEQPKWWLSYFEVLGSFGLKSRWIAFRRRRIIDEFEKALVQARGHLALISSPDSSPVTLQSQVVAFSKPSENVPQSLRDLAHAAIDRMTESELRLLSVPLGYLIDSLKK